MCILFIAVDMHPKWPLIVCANRDEFHHRPTEPAHFWPIAASSTNQATSSAAQILAGKDLQAGGTWLGVNKLGQFSALTNIRLQSEHEGMRSRGELVLKALSGDGLLNQQWLQQHSDNYSPFNLVYQQDNQLWCFNSATAENLPLSKGFHAVSNGALDDVWPKMAKGQQALEQHVLSHDEPDIAQMLSFMRDESEADDTSLPNTGIDLEWERLLSAIFIKHPEYGTRSTSVVMQDSKGNIEFTEVRYDGKSRNLGQQRFSISTE
ncbi:NRDE family protein [Shewanella electrodiphila]|uniref:NRDE family protein n=1 Tax=Shewanella electrodiphila TaxID=934143 RepID=A0ABT0KTN7_9GAMM|nr:NRDE family protein [Shewanella electrodiphila]MCL1047217.1 NRDE family protein [Shewanella electrodiphila]